MYFSQFSQDRIAEQFFSKVYKTEIKKLKYLELGAVDGVWLSNTLMFEKKYGCYGILIEPVYEQYEKLVRNRSENNYFFNCLVTDSDDDELNFVGDHVVDFDSGLKIRTMKMSSIIKSTNIGNNINYFSLDVEGCESMVLQGINFDEVSFDFITIEFNKTPENNKKCDEILNNFGYVKMFTNVIDAIYINSRNKSLKSGINHLIQLTNFGYFGDRLKLNKDILKPFGFC